jgi:hypothetical protein
MTGKISKYKKALLSKKLIDVASFVGVDIGREDNEVDRVLDVCLGLDDGRKESKVATQGRIKVRRV